jgi:hypothetical protein
MPEKREHLPSDPVSAGRMGGADVDTNVGIGPAAARHSSSSRRLVSRSRETTCLVGYYDQRREPTT